MPPEAWERPDKQPADGEVAIDYLKAPGFAVHWADGAIGGITPSGCIHIAIYSERQAIPRRSVYATTPDGKLGAEIEGKRISRDAVVRELSCDVRMTPEVAEQLAKWLLGVVADAKSSSPATNEQER